MENEILNLLLETLKIQAEKYKIIVSEDSLTHEQRKEFDTEITQMYNVLANLSNSSTIYTLAELKGLKAQYDVKFSEFDEKVSNLDLSHLLVSFDSLTQEQKDSLKGQNGLSAFDIAVNNGFEGSEPEWLLSLKGANGTFEDLTQEQKDSLKGQNGLSAYDIAVNNGFEGSEPEWLESLKGADGQDGQNAIFDFDSLDTIQKEKISTYLFNLTQFTELLQRITNLESNSTGGENPTPETPTTDNNSLFINIPADSNSYDYKLSYTPQIGDIIEINATLEDGTVLKEDGSIVDYEGNLIFSSNWNYEYPTDLQPAFNVNPGSNFLFINNDISDSQGNKLSISQQLEVILIRNETKIKLELLEFTTDRTVSDSWWQ